MNEIYRILDVNFNRAREALRVAEDCGRFALNDPAITATAKSLRSDLKEVLDGLPAEMLIVSRDTPGDTGTELTTPTEQQRDGDALARARHGPHRNRFHKGGHDGRGDWIRTSDLRLPKPAL